MIYFLIGFFSAYILLAGVIWLIFGKQIKTMVKVQKAATAAKLKKKVENEEK